MSDTQVLLSKIAALREQLEQVQGFVKDAGAAAATLLQEGVDGTRRVWRLERQVAAGLQHNQLLDGSIRQLVGPSSMEGESPTLPRQLTSRARRVLLYARELLEQLRALADDSLLHQEDTDPLTLLYRETTAMADAALRMVQAFPDAPSAQLHLCEGLEAIVQVTAERVARITGAVGQRRREMDRLHLLVEILTAMQQGQLREVQPLLGLAKTILAEVQQAEPLRFVYASPEVPARFVAAHSLTVAQVVARVVRHDAELRSQALEAVVAALVHDVGMLSVAAEILASPGPLTDAQRRTVESHTRTGAQLATRLLPGGAWLAEATGGHHERLDGTGYPAGLRDLQIAPLTRLLAVCDVYAAFCCPRPYRPAFDTRTALTDTLLLAEQGALDRQQAERLLLLSFYPVGTVVELADGTVAMVVATHLGRRDLNTPARPVLALLTDIHGQALPAPRHVDLAQCDNHSIVRTLRPEERRELLGRRYPELV
jgi:HD-GYP domain-containing protein (c-di-GMP phosphodiesterase class II)